MRQPPQDPSSQRSESLAALRVLGYNAVPKSNFVIRGKTQSVTQILDSATSLSQLQALARDGQNRLKAILPLLPVSMRSLVQSGGVESDSWCILVPNSAMAAKLRQLLPSLCAHLRTKGWNVQAITVKVINA
jgi:hypothetical protein